MKEDSVDKELVRGNFLLKSFQSKSMWSSLYYLVFGMIVLHYNAVSLESPLVTYITSECIIT
jgi:hypothetical protein